MEPIRGFCSCLTPKNDVNIRMPSQSPWRGKIVSILTSAYSFLQRCFSAQNTPTVARTARKFTLSVKQATAIQFDPTMINLQQFIVNVSVLMGNSLYTHFVQPAIQNFQNQSPEIQAKLDALADVIATACANEIMSGFDNTLSCIDSHCKALITWLLQGTSNEDLSRDLQSKFSNLSPDFITSFIASISDKSWLANTSSLNCSAPVASDPGILKTLLTATLQKLIDVALHALFTKICQTLQNLPLSDLPTTIQTNSQIIGQSIATRFTTLIQAASPVNPTPGTLTLYQQAYDHIVDLVYKQIEAVIATDSDMTKFCQQDACDPAVRQMLTPPSGQDQATYQTQIEEAISLQFASDFIPLLLPDVRTVSNNITTVVPGVIVLLQKLQLPPSVLSTIQQFLQWPASLFPDGPPASVQTLFDSSAYFMQRALAALINDQIETGLGIGLNLGMNMVVPPIYLTMWMVEGAFPALFPALVKALFLVKLNDAGHSISDQFLPLANPSCDRASFYQTLLPSLQNTIQDMCKDVPFADIGITPDVFKTQLTPLLNQIGDLFVANGSSKSKVDRHDIAKWLKEYATPIDAGSNSTYGRLIEDLIFHVGKINALGNVKFAEFISQDFLTGIMSKTLTSAMYPLRQSEELIVGGIVNGLATIMSTQDQVDALLFGKPTPPVDMTAQLQTQLNQISTMVYALINTLIDQLQSDSHWYSKFFEDNGVKALKALLPSQKDQYEAYNRVYNGVLGNRYLNENLYIQLVQIIIDTLKAANTQLMLPS